MGVASLPAYCLRAAHEVLHRSALPKSFGTQLVFHLAFAIDPVVGARILQHASAALGQRPLVNLLDEYHGRLVLINCSLPYPRKGDLCSDPVPWNHAEPGLWDKL